MEECNSKRSVKPAPHKIAPFHSKRNNVQVLEGFIFYLQFCCASHLLIARSSCLDISVRGGPFDNSENSPGQRWDHPIRSPIHLQIPGVPMVYLDMSSTQYHIGRARLPQNIRFERVPCPAWYACTLLARTCLEYRCPREQALHNFDALAYPTNLHVDHGTAV
jgi:hypothetical protein